MPRPWGVHVLGDVYHPDCQAGLPDGRWVSAVAVPYPANAAERIRASWWVLTGRAVAFIYPKAGDLEDIFKGRKPVLDRTPARPFEQMKSSDGTPVKWI